MRRAWSLLLLVGLAGCRPIVDGKGQDPLLGEWQVARVEGQGERPFFVLTLQPGGALTLFGGGESRAGAWAAEGDQLMLRVPGYPARGYTLLRREGGFDLRDEAAATTFFLEDRNGFDAMGLLGPLLLGVLGLAVLLPAAGALRVRVCASTWPEARAEVEGAHVEVTRHGKHVGRDEPTPAGHERERSLFGPDRLTWRSHRPRVTFRYVVDGEERRGTNDAPHAHRAGYTAEEAAGWVERWRREGLTVRYDPRRPGVVYLGAAHFPLWSSLLLALVGSVLAIGLAAAAGVVAGWFNLEVVKVGTTDWTALAVLGGLPAYLLAARVAAMAVSPPRAPR